MELAGPADERFYVGCERADAAGQYLAFPFFDSLDAGSALDFDVEGRSEFHHRHRVSTFPEESVSRDLGAAIDTWSAGDLTFRIISPVRSVPDPDHCDVIELKRALTPAILCEITLDNRHGTSDRKVFLGYTGAERNAAMRVAEGEGFVGVAQGLQTAIITRELGVYAGIAWQPEAILDPTHASNLRFLLGNLGMLVATVKAGQRRTLKFSIAFFREGTVTTGIRTRYLYRRWFDSVEQVALAALDNFEETLEESIETDQRLRAGQTEDRSFMLAQAIRSYFGATQCLEMEDGRPLWIVNEGEYRMMNTFDLMVDQAFFELALNPWTLRNELDFYVERYSYRDQARLPNDPALHPGGLAFTHDVGIANAFSDRGQSGYEQAGLRGCFSYMSCEELVNWVLCAALYHSQTSDLAWLEGKRQTLIDCLESLANRDHPEPGRRNGVMGLDSNRCEGGAEITTYDSLDASLGQARNNTYLAVKTWAAYVLLDRMLHRLGEEPGAELAATQAQKASRTLIDSAKDGILPAVIGEGVNARIIPAIEGLIYPFLAGAHDVLSPKGEFGELILTLQTHLMAVLSPGVCKFPDGGWRLSSSSRNSWLSKIYLCQFVSESILGFAKDTRADAAHAAWLTRGENAYYAWSDQMLEGRAVGSRYYPRGVTSILWLAGNCKDPINAIADHLGLRTPPFPA